MLGWTLCKLYNWDGGTKAPFVNTLRPRQNGHHFPDDIFKWIFFNENVWISINISLKFLPRGTNNNIPTFVQIMAWRRPGDKPLSEPMMVSLPTQICVTRPQWVKFSISKISNLAKVPVRFFARITFIFDRYHRAWAAATPDKYQRDIQYLTWVLAMLKNSENNGTEKIGLHYNDVTIDAIASQITSLMIVYSIVYSNDIKEYIEKNLTYPESTNLLL